MLLQKGFRNQGFGRFGFQEVEERSFPGLPGFICLSTFES